MLNFILSSIPIIGKIIDAYSAYAQKKEDVALEKYKVDGRVDSDLILAHVSIIQAQRDLLKNQWLVALQVGFGVPLMIYYGKCVLWDATFGWGHTDPLWGDISKYSLWIVGFLFLHSTISDWGRKTK